MLVDCPTCGAKRGIVCTSVGKLVAGVHVERARLAGLKVAADRVVPVKGNGTRKMAREVPEDLEAMRAQARSATCSTCGAQGWITGNPGECNATTPEPFEYGVHVARARAAGLPPFPCAADLDAGAKPVLVDVPASLDVHEGFGVKPAWLWHPGRGAEVWLALPWGPTCGECAGARQVADGVGDAPLIPCPDCHGTGRAPLYVPYSAGVPDAPPERLTFQVSAEHRATFGERVVLTRGVHIAKTGRLCWMFRAKEGQGS